MEQRLNVNRGFSIIELMVVMVIIALLLSVAIPNMNKTIAIYRINTAASSIVSDIRLVQQESRSKETTSSIAFDLDNNQYDLNINGVLLETKKLPTTVVIVSTDFTSDTLTFGSDDLPGHPDNSGDIELEIDGYELTKVINVVADSGRVTLE